MNETELKKLWDKLQNKINVGTFESFKSKMDTAEKRKSFFNKYYEKLKNDYKLNLGKYNDFEKRLSDVVNPQPNPNQQTQTTGLPTWTTNYPCLSDYSDNMVKAPKRDDMVLFLFSNENHVFYKNMRFFRYDKSKNEIDRGSWECKDGKLVITTNYGWQWSKDVGAWTKVSKTNTTQNPKANTGSKNTYTKCDETLPIKQGCNNETIRRVQACLRMPKRFQTGNFGKTTQGYLESSGQNGTLITIETIINVCGTNDPLVKNVGSPGGVSTSPQSKTGYEDYSFDEIESETESSSGSETESSSGSDIYAGYSDEEIDNPVMQKTVTSTSNDNSLRRGKQSFINQLDNNEVEQ
jgi:hypothetical protein